MRAVPATTLSGISPEQVAEYHDRGFLMLRNVFDAAEMAALGAEADSLFSRRELIDTANIRCRWSNHAESDECTFDCFDPVIDLGTVCGQIAHDHRILDPLRAIYDGEAHLFKDKLIFKSPGLKGYALHQDYIGWKTFPESFITVIVAIDATGPENGATEVFPYYHKQGYLSPKDDDYHELPLSAIDESTGVLLDLEPGDVAMFGGFTPHRSGPNRSMWWRRQLYLSYNAGRDGGAQRDAHYRQFHDWLVKKYAQHGKTGVYFK